MRKAERIPFKQFMSGEYKDQIKKVKQIKKGKIYKVVMVSGIVLILFATGIDATLAATGNLNGVGIERGAEALYKILLKVGKWIIIVKGGIDTINNLLSGDYGQAKKGFLTYLIVYVILHGLPWALGQVDGIFEEANKPVTSMR